MHGSPSKLSLAPIDRLLLFVCTDMARNLGHLLRYVHMYIYFLHFQLTFNLKHNQVLRQEHGSVTFRPLRKLLRTDQPIDVHENV